MKLTKKEVLKMSKKELENYKWSDDLDKKDNNNCNNCDDCNYCYLVWAPALGFGA
jgi:hypothetical protein